MFDLEQAIAEWRERMSDGGLRHPEILEELESHLREELESQIRAGRSPEEAFDAAVEHVGRADVLKHEFANAITPAERLKDAMLTLAGIPNHNFSTTMNTSYSEPGWVTYLKATTFLLPGIFLALLAAVFIVPKLQQICIEAGLPTATAGTFWNLTYSSIQVILVMLRHGVFIAGAIIVLLVLLEWRVKPWARYRRAAVGCGAFVVNSIVLLAFFMMFLAAIVAAPALTHVAK
jgi:hypothetical protein